MTQMEHAKKSDVLTTNILERVVIQNAKIKKVGETVRNARAMDLNVLNVKITNFGGNHVTKNVAIAMEEHAI